ncbi:MAG: integrase DNA-binding domain-containing protein, partial [Oscillospiraceae bacterium]|nr:integrase DNA-binding domain-containing protein [Oscillospiraceae bacterium]
MRCCLDRATAFIFKAVPYKSAEATCFSSAGNPHRALIPVWHSVSKGTGGFVAAATTYFHDAGKVCEGRYRFRYQDAAGKRKTVYSWRLNETDPQPKGKRTCEALRTLEKQISRDLDNGINSQSASKITVNQAFENAMNANQKKRPSTRTLQRGIYENHIREQLGSLPLARISRDMMKEFYLRLYTEKNLAPGTIMTVYIVLNPLFEEQVKNGNLRVNNSSLALSNVKKLVKWETAPRHALTAKEQEAFVNFYSTTPAYSKWVPLLDVLLGTGMRIGEALS